MSVQEQVVSAVLAGIAVLFHVLDHRSDIHRKSGWRVRDVNLWLAGKFQTSTKRILQVETGGLFVFGFTAMQIGEWAAAVGIWVLLAILLSWKAWRWDGVPRQPGITLLLR